MKRTAYGKPLLINQDQMITPLEKIDSFDELYIQNIIFNSPECLPISDIDESYNPVIPVCMELNTSAGPLDILMVNPNGELAIIETKLWRNPEARRVVVAQILDYAKELSNWTYEDLQREINKRLKRKGNSLYEIAKSLDPDLVPTESDFVDSVSRNLSRGKFLLLIAGDGIREGMVGIAEFLANAGHLNFTFALVELNLYSAQGMRTLVIPKTLVKTTEISKYTIEIPEGLTITTTELEQDSMVQTAAFSPEQEKEKQFYRKFWSELVAELNFDDPGQPLPVPANAQNLYVYPAKSKKAWISAYFAKSQKRIGVYFRVRDDQEGQEIFNTLTEDKKAIIDELGDDITSDWNNLTSIGVRLACENIFASENRDTIK